MCVLAFGVHSHACSRVCVRNSRIYCCITLYADNTEATAAAHRAGQREWMAQWLANELCRECVCVHKQPLSDATEKKTTHIFLLAKQTLSSHGSLAVRWLLRSQIFLETCYILTLFSQIDRKNTPEHTYRKHRCTVSDRCAGISITCRLSRRTTTCTGTRV